MLRTDEARRAFAAIVALASVGAWAEPDSFGVGTGRSGSLTVAGTQSVNVATPLQQSVVAGATSVQAGNAALFQAGDLMMLHQTQSAMAAVSGDAAAIDLANVPLGLFELARVASV